MLNIFKRAVGLSLILLSVVAGVVTAGCTDGPAKRSSVEPMESLDSD